MVTAWGAGWLSLGRPADLSGKPAEWGSEACTGRPAWRVWHGGKAARPGRKPGGPADPVTPLEPARPGAGTDAGNAGNWANE